MTTARSALDRHLAALHPFDPARLADGFAPDAVLRSPGGEGRGCEAIVARLERTEPLRRLEALRTERIELADGMASVDWWGSSGRGAEAWTGRHELFAGQEGLIERLTVSMEQVPGRAFRSVRFEIEPPLARIVLDRDEKRNAVSQAMLAEMTEFVAEVGRRPDLRALVLAGAGRGFCAGEDVRGFRFPDPATAQAFLEGPHRFFEALEVVPKPVVAAVHGFALGFGAEVLLAVDGAYASAGTTFGFAEIDHPAVPAVLVSRGLDIVFRRRALSLALTGRRFDAAEAAEARLVHDVVEDPVAAAEEAAREMAGWSPEAVATTKGLLGHDAPDDHNRVRDFMPAVLLQTEAAI